MSIQSLAKQFVDLCNQAKNFDVMHSMYAENIVSVESGGNETAGKAAVIAKSEKWAAVNTIHGEKVAGPFFNGPNEFAVYFTFEITPNATGKRISQDEVAVYEVKDGKIVRERFFNGGLW